ncbi:unnamed protein product, partial [Polarella glacialis]
VWHEAKARGPVGGYVGAYLTDGLHHKAILDLSEELRRRLPNILGKHALRFLWAYSYDHRYTGVNLHADDAAVNVNIWLTPDSANLDPDGGGLVVFDAAPPSGWGPEEYAAAERANDGGKALLSTPNSEAVATVAYRANRMVLFDSTLLHKTDVFRFREALSQGPKQSMESLSYDERSHESTAFPRRKLFRGMLWQQLPLGADSAAAGVREPIFQICLVTLRRKELRLAELDAVSVTSTFQMQTVTCDAIARESVFLSPESRCPTWGEPMRRYLDVKQCLSSWKDIVIPGHTDYARIQYMKRQNRRSAERRLLMTFHGRAPESHGAYGDCAVRGQLMKLGERFGIESGVDIGGFVGDYLERKGDSHFCLVPAGTSPWTNHLYESFHAGCVPVILSDEYE